MTAKRRLKQETWALKRITPSDQNARRHPPEQIALLQGSLREYGWTFPLLVDEKGVLLAGHGRYEAALANRMTTAPVIVARGWTELQKRAYRVLDNQVALGSEWDEARLSAELAALQDSDVDLAGLGFSRDDLSQLRIPGFMIDEQLNDADQVLALPTKAVTEPGDVWLVGAHRILCGDSTKADDVKLALDGAEPHLMVTDPPYGVEYEATWRHTAKRSDGTRLSIGAHSMGAVSNDDRVDWSAAWKLFRGDVVYCWHSGLHASIVQESLEEAGFLIRSQIIWNKNVMIISRGQYHFKHEPCWYAIRKGKTAHWSGDRKQTSVWDIQIVHVTAGDANDGKNHHSTQKPVECMRRPILNNSKPGDLVYDPFLGSGTTAVAAQMEGRACIGIELEPIYVDVVIRRLQKFSGLTATLEDDGSTFEETAKDRK